MGLTQKEMAEKIGKPQSVISRLEDDEYGKVSVQTLLDVAQAVDVALLVQFVSYPDFLERMRDKSPARMVPENITESTARMNRAVAAEALLQFSGSERQTVRTNFGRMPELQNCLLISARNRDEKFNSTDSALMQTGHEARHSSRQTIQ
jgi:transcriptional regulator with XRE-family HTH domain